MESEDKPLTYYQKKKLEGYFIKNKEKLRKQAKYHYDRDRLHNIETIDGFIKEEMKNFSQYMKFKVLKYVMELQKTDKKYTNIIRN